MKKFLSVFLSCMIFSAPIIAAEFDASIDETIRNNYNVEKNSNLPPLPTSVPTVVEKVEIPDTPLYNPTGKVYSVKTGTKVKLVSTKSITDWTPKGSVISFKSTTGFVTKDGTIIPAGTIFPSRAMTTLKTANGNNSVTVFYETQTDKTFVKDENGAWYCPDDVEEIETETKPVKKEYGKAENIMNLLLGTVFFIGTILTIILLGITLPKIKALYVVLMVLWVVVALVCQIVALVNFTRTVAVGQLDFGRVEEIIIKKEKNK